MLTIVAAIALLPYGPVPQPDSVLALFLRTQFETIAFTDSLPIGVGTDRVMANPGEPFNKTDLVDGDLPMQRLIVAGRSDSLWFVYYEQGGVAYSRNLVLFDYREEQPKTLYVLSPLEDVGIEGIRDAVSKGAMLTLAQLRQLRKEGKTPPHGTLLRLYSDSGYDLSISNR